MSYGSHILDHAKRDIKKLPTKDLQKDILQICTVALEENPFPSKCKPIAGHKNLFRVLSTDRKYRIIYSVQEHLKVVIILVVRKRSESTYKRLPLASLTSKILELESDFL